MDLSVDNDDECFACGIMNEGVMVCCDGCPRSFHHQCINLHSAPQTKTWYCPICSKTKSPQYYEDNRATFREHIEPQLVWHFWEFGALIIFLEEYGSILHSSIIDKFSPILLAQGLSTLATPSGTFAQLDEAHKLVRMLHLVLLDAARPQKTMIGLDKMFHFLRNFLVQNELEPEFWIEGEYDKKDEEHYWAAPVRVRVHILKLLCDEIASQDENIRQRGTDNRCLPDAGEKADDGDVYWLYQHTDPLRVHVYKEISPEDQSGWKMELLSCATTLAELMSLYNDMEHIDEVAELLRTVYIPHFTSVALEEKKKARYLERMGLTIDTGLAHTSRRTVNKNVNYAEDISDDDNSSDNEASSSSNPEDWNEEENI